MRTKAGNTHPRDGELIRLLDGELTTAEAAALREHLQGCGSCAARLRELTRRSDRIAALLTGSGGALVPPPLRHDAAAPAPHDAGRATPVRSRPVVAPWLRAAAVLAVLLAGAFFAPPVRAWMTERVDAALAWFDDPPAAAPVTGGTTLRVPAQGEAIEVRMVRPAHDAVLLLRRTTGDDAVLEVPAPGAEVTLLPDGFRIEDAAPGEPYRLALPLPVRRVRLRVDDARVVEIPVPERGEVRIPMSGSPR